ncbi:MAG: beta-galactosidase GalA [Lacibacter sp.]
MRKCFNGNYFSSARVTVMLLLMICFISSNAQQSFGPREHVLIDDNWRFAFGHLYDAEKDFQTGTGYFSYFAKAAYGDGAAAAGFDDRHWRKLNLPHDWAVELPFNSTASKSHGYKAIGRNFPSSSVGWYRKKIFIPKTDEGKRISIAFDGVYRNFSVWVNGFYLGNEPSGYTGVEYNISEYLNYGGENSIAVRVDASIEEGWFYEGAGIYRHVWINKTKPVHVISNGTFVTTTISNGTATVQAAVTVVNESKTVQQFHLKHTLIDAEGKKIAEASTENIRLISFAQQEIKTSLNVNNPKLWSLESPHLYKLITEVIKEDAVEDSYSTTFGIRTIHFDAKQGFFLNGKKIKITGTNNHQDHAGVGVAVPDALLEFRIKKLKEFGCNAYRCSHNPPSPELLDICDRLGMLVIDENRLMGVSSLHFDYLKRFIVRDRNHPSIISWSIGNEEWGIEGNELGVKIATTMQAFVKTIDSTRGITAAISGGWQKGISNVIDIMGVNYVGQINTDLHHAEFPDQPMWGTEEGSTRATRGAYVDDDASHTIAAYDKKPFSNFVSIEEGWKHYASRDYLAGMFIWTGFDYRGEPTPFEWPSVTSYFGMLDLCGFPKDNVWYLKSWWTNDTVLHLLPHWNWKKGDSVNVWAYSNCDEVELFLNKKSMGKQNMERNGHLEWKINYQPGILEAVGYKNGKKVKTDKVTTTGAALSINLSANNQSIAADGKDISVITVSAKDKNGLTVPIADNEISFTISGPSRIIGVGNGNPVSLEKERFIESVTTVEVQLAKEKIVDAVNEQMPELQNSFNDAAWNKAFKDDRTKEFGKKAKWMVYRGRFIMPQTDSNATITFFSRNIGVQQSVYINGVEVAKNMDGNRDIIIDSKLLHAGVNLIAITAKPLLKNQPWDVVNMNPGVLQVMTPVPQWRRKLFNGFAQVIVQSTGEKGTVILKAESKGLQSSQLLITTR